MTESFSAATRQLNPEIYQRFKKAIELGKWPDGRRLSTEQREICMQAVINYELEHVAEEERSGYMEQRCASGRGGAQDIFASDS